MRIKYTCVLERYRAVLALANVGPQCDPCGGGGLNVIVQNKIRTNVLVFQRTFVWKFEIFPFVFFKIIRKTLMSAGPIASN
jgi:hypothetical protein